MAKRTLSRMFAWLISSMLLVGAVSLVSNNASAGNFSGTITEGQTITYDVTVSSTMSPIVVYLYWTTFGDDLDMKLYDPSHTLVENADATADFVEWFIVYPTTTGTYTLDVIGYTVNSASSISYTGTCTNNIALHSSGLGGPLDLTLIILLIVVIAVVVIVVVLVLVMGKKKKAMAGAPGQYPIQPGQTQYAQTQYQQMPPQTPPYQPGPSQYPPMQPPIVPPQASAGQATYCPSCGRRVDPGAVFCPGCGRPMK